MTDPNLRLLKNAARLLVPVLEENGDTKLDVMPLDETILGFSNRWYEAALASAQNYELELGLHIRAVTAPYFCATKIEAFRGRGKGDYLSSHDLEDLITVVDGRPELVNELRSASDDVRSYPPMLSAGC